MENPIRKISFELVSDSTLEEQMLEHTSLHVDAEVQLTTLFYIYPPI